MTFVVEDGTGLINANSYSSVEYADAYFLERGVTGWTGTTQQKQGFLIQATDYLEMKTYYGVREFPSHPQKLSFPRLGIVIDGIEQRGIPEKVKMATCEVAIRAVKGLLFPDLDINDPRSGAVKRMRREVKGVQSSGVVKEFEYFPDIQNNSGSVRIPVVDRLLKGFVTSGTLEVYR